MKVFNRLPLIGSLLIALALFGCKTSTEPSTTVGNNQIQFASNASATYTQNRLDTANGKYGKDQIDPTMTDTLRTTIVDTALTFQGKSPVVEMVNTHSNGSINDTTYMYQATNGDLYRYNYGVESLNNNATVTNFTGGPIQLGWVLQARMDQAQGTTWNADSTARLKLSTYGSIPLALTGVMQADTTVMVNGSAVTARHASITILANAGPLGSASGLVDTYVNTKYGMVLNVVHSSSVNLGSVIQSSGTRTAMIAHN